MSIEEQIPSDIQITIPLDVLGDVKNLTPQSIREALMNRTEIRHLESALNTSNQIVNQFGRNLHRILDEVDDPFEKAKALRRLGDEAKKWGKP